MIIAGEFSFNNGSDAIEQNYPKLLDEVKEVVSNIDASQCRTKESKEKTMSGRMLYSPVELNKHFKKQFGQKDWHSQKVSCEYPTKYYSDLYDPAPLNHGAFREMDFLKERVGVEVQFGKYAFMVYNVCAKMTIFHNLDFIDFGVEIVPVKGFADHMSTGVSYFEQFVWDLEKRGISDIDIPVLILGVSD